jgi:toxin YoeB
VKELNGWISRRISWKSRLVYKIDEQNIWIASCRGHYEVLFPIIFN